MKNRISILVLLVFLITVFSGCIAEEPSKPALKKEGLITRTVFDNGLTLIVKEVHATPIVALDIFVGTGSLNEDDRINGISHFFEHMLFKGTEKRGVGQIDLEIDSVGGYNNAATSMDFTHYYVVVASQYFDVALDVVSDAIMNSAFDPVEIEKERMVILEEKRRSLDNPYHLMYNYLFETAFLNHPYRRTVLGTMESISGIKREDFLNYHEQYYVPNNVVVVIVGDINTEEVVSEVESAFKDFKPKNISQTSYLKEKPQNKTRRKILERDFEQTYMGIAFHGPSAESRDIYTLDLIATILGEGRSSRLNLNIKEEKQLVTSINAYFLTLKEPSLFLITSTLKEENLEKAENEIIEEVLKLTKEPVPIEELEKAKKQLIIGYSYEMETNLQQARMLGYYQNIAGDYNFAINYPDGIKKVSQEDVIRVAQKYFGKENYSIVIIKPKGD